MQKTCAALVVSLALSTLNSQRSTLHAQGTAFTYQGRLNDGASPASGSYDLSFTLYGGPLLGTPLAGPLTNSAVPVTNGLFTVPLDFGSQFPGADRWLRIAARTNGASAFTILFPRQQLTPTPYAITAESVSPGGGLTGVYSNAVTLNNANNNLSGIFTGSGAGLTNINAAQLGGLSAGNFWQTTGNSGTSPGTNFLGTTDNQPLELRVNNSRGLRLEPNANGAPNVIGGSPANYVAPGVVGSVIAGGGATGAVLSNSISFDLSAIGGGAANKIGTNSKYGTIGGGFNNIIADSASWSTIAGGAVGSIGSASSQSILGGGGFNMIGTNSGNGFIGGGVSNSIGNNVYAGVVVGGRANNVGDSADFGAIGGGDANSIRPQADHSTIAGGFNNTILNRSDHSVIVAGEANVIASDGPHNAIGGGQDNVIGQYTDSALIAGGAANTIGTNSHASAIGGGAQNFIFASVFQGYIGGGFHNYIGDGSGFSTIGGGSSNTIPYLSNSVPITCPYATIPGGRDNLAAAPYTFAAGRLAGALHMGAFVWGDSAATNIVSTNANSVTIRASGGYRLFSNTNATAGVFLAPGGSAWASISDRNAKKNFQPVDGKEVLEKLAQVPVQKWNYKSEADDGVPHIGPMAQDFKGAFYPGRDDKTISTLEFDGVELAAIQGLNEKLEAEVQQKDARIGELEKRLTDLEQQVQALSAKK